MAMFSSLSPQPVRFEPIWTGLADGIGKIVTMSGVKGMPLVEDVYKLCTAQPTPYSEELYLRLRDFLERHVDGLRESILQHQSDMLTDYLKKWKAYSIGCEYCNAIFRYLNNNWIRKKLEDTRNKLVGVFQGPTASTEVYEVYTLALVIWRDRLFLKIKDRVIRALLELIQRDRDGDQVNHSEVRGVIESYVKLGIVNKNKPLEIYKEDFEGPFLAATRDYYARESASFVAANGVANYMKKAETRIEEEAVRGKRYLDSSSYDKLRKEVDQVLIERHKDALHAECEPMLRDDKQQDLSRMYHLLTRIDDGLRPMLDSLQSYTETFGMEALKGLQQDAKSQDPKAYVECLLAIYLQFSEVVKKAFDNDSAFTAALDKACRKIVNESSLNESSARTPELLARHCDLLLKKGKAVLDDKQLEDKLNQILLIFKYVDDKDVFQKFYSKMLARRLIHGQSISGDMESFMIGGLKQVCGYEYTSRLQRMFTDMSTSIDLNDKFREAVNSKGIDIGRLDASILVLTAGSWPLSEPQSHFIVPQELELCITEFQKWYSAQSHGRKLNWLHQLSKADIRITYLKRKYEIQVMGYQIGVLLLFNTAGDEGLSMEDIGKGMGVKDQELLRCVQSLVDAHILKKEGPGKSVSITDTIVLNKAFTSKRLKLKITAAVAGDTPQQHQATIESIEEDRKLYLQAAIVRIMKARKTLTHAQLVQETIQQSKARFSPHIPMIKKCIEQLIEKEYLARVEGEANRYSYVA